jgi:putative ABC transport system permease protein
MPIAHRNLLQDRVRLALSVAGVALAVMLILLLGGFLTGLFRQISAYLDHAPGSILVAQDGVTNLLGATSLLPPTADDAAQEVEGVEEVVPILSQFIILELHGKKQPAYLVGYEPARGGGPWRLVAGREPQADDEMVFDRVLAQRHGVALGDGVQVMDRQFTVVGFSDGTASWMTSFLWLEDGEFKDMVTMATDPVCGMAVEREKAVSAAWGGGTFYFCADGCRNEFLADPDGHSARKVVAE